MSAAITSPPSAVPSPETVRVDGPKAPWFRRKPKGDDPTNPNGHGLVDLGQWPEEPKSPPHVDEKRFADALARLCPRYYRKGAALYAGWILKHSRAFDVDPMTVGALAFYQSNCRARFFANGSYGLSAINVGMHAGYIKDRKYRYWVRKGAAWVERTLPLRKHLFYARSLRHAEPNIYFAAALLKIFTEQCHDLDAAFGSVRHRHPVSHFYWGDRVRGTDAEDRVLRARRRLIGYYDGTPAATVTWRGLTLQSPLDGSPRKLTSKMGDRRDGGRRPHRGVDFASDRGEPVYAIADGVVKFAGAQRRVGGTHNISAAEARAIPAKELGKGGLLVMVEHAGDIKSAYMHLDDYRVKARQSVKRGDLLGYVGRTGIQSSWAHLHFEIREGEKHLDPEPALGPLTLSPLKTFRGLRMEADRKRGDRKRR